MPRRPLPTPSALLCLGLLVLLVPRISAQPNVLLIIADDLGVDKVAAYGEHPDPGNTPVIDQLAAEGVLFRNVWANPLCSPSRAALLTGRYSFRTGIGTFVAFEDTIEVSVQEPTIPKLLPPAYRSAAIGKWHISASSKSHLQHPMLLGFEHHRGSISNFPTGQGEDYFNYMKNVDGVEVFSTTYATTDSVDEALGLMATFGSEPWFIWLAFNAPHTPYHHPPDELHSFDLPNEVEESPIFMKALTEAMDTEMGRLFDSMDPATLADTVIIFIGDNGTKGVAIEPPWDPERGKSTVYEGGINVPLIVKGPGVVAGDECAGLVDVTDILGTVLELTGVTEWPSEDSVSLVPYFSDPALPSLRSWVFAEKFRPNASPFNETNHCALRDDRYKLRFISLEQEIVLTQLFDLQQDPLELQNIINSPLDAGAQVSLGALLAQLAVLQPPPFGSGIGRLGGALSGSSGPVELFGMGSLIPDAPYTLALSGAVENAPAVLVVGSTIWMVPFKGGTLAPSPDLVIGGFSTGPTGGFTVQDDWPTDVPSGSQLAMQFWIVDPAGPSGSGYAASNGVALLTP